MSTTQDNYNIEMSNQTQRGSLGRLQMRGDGTLYVLPQATDTELGGVKLRTNTNDTYAYAEIDSTGHVRIPNVEIPTIPLATSTTAGVVKVNTSFNPDDSIVSIDESGFLRYKDTDTLFTLTKATETELGGIKAPTATTSQTEQVGIDENGNLLTKPITTYNLPQASLDLGGVKANPKDDTQTLPVSIDSDGYLWVKPADVEELNISIPIATDLELGGIKAPIKSNQTEIVGIDSNGNLFSKYPNSATDVEEGLVKVPVSEKTPESTEVYQDNTGSLHVNIPTPETTEQYELPQATDTELGGVKAPSATTQSEPVAISPDGNLLSKYPNSATSEEAGLVKVTPATTQTEIVGIDINENLVSKYPNIATATEPGLVKIPTSTPTENYAEVLQDSDNKLYVDIPETELPEIPSYTLPQANETTLGGVYSTPLTEEDVEYTEEVKISSEGKLYTKPGGGGEVVNPDNVFNFIGVFDSLDSVPTEELKDGDVVIITDGTENLIYIYKDLTWNLIGSNSVSDNEPEILSQPTQSLSFTVNELSATSSSSLNVPVSHVPGSEYLTDNDVELLSITTNLDNQSEIKVLTDLEYLDIYNEIRFKDGEVSYIDFYVNGIYNRRLRPGISSYNNISSCKILNLKQNDVITIEIGSSTTWSLNPDETYSNVITMTAKAMTTSEVIFTDTIPQITFDQTASVILEIDSEDVWSPSQVNEWTAIPWKIYGKSTNLPDDISYLGTYPNQEYIELSDNVSEYLSKIQFEQVALFNQSNKYDSSVRIVAVPLENISEIHSESEDFVNAVLLGQINVSSSGVDRASTLVTNSLFTKLKLDDGTLVTRDGYIIVSQFKTNNILDGLLPQSRMEIDLTQTFTR